MDSALVPMADLADRWGVTSNTVSRRFAFLGIKPIRQGNFRFISPEDLERGEALNHHILSGKPMDSFPQQNTEGRVVRSVKQQVSRLDASEEVAAIIAKTIAACSFSLPADPLRRAKALAEAADNALVLTTDELVALGVKGIASFANGDLAYGYCFIKHEQRNRTLWMVERCFAAPAGSAKALPASKQNKQVGFASCLTISAISLPMFNC